MQQADATQAYTQAELGGRIKTWIKIQENQWPPEWKEMKRNGQIKDPVCPLVKALYGHPDSGGDWEKHCEKHVVSEGFVPVADWRSCYFHPERKLLLVIYVDDVGTAPFPAGNNA